MRNFIVVYQFGKVASTSLVETLNRLPEVRAVQAHFLGQNSLKEMVDLMVNPNTSSLFHEHSIGQFIENTNTTRIINSYRFGVETESKLSIISLYRDPFKWFRSSIIQDICDYLTVLRSLGDEGEDTSVTDETIARQALEKMLVLFSGVIRESGGIDVIVNNRMEYRKILSEHICFVDNKRLLDMFYMTLRPFSWFKFHYGRAIGYEPDDLTKISHGVYFLDAGWASLFILRYEDIENQINVTAEQLDIGPIGRISIENVSNRKPMFEPVRQAFESEAALELRTQFSESEYSRRFNYV